MEHQIDQIAASSTETLTPSLTKQTYHEGKIVAFTITDMHRATIDDWSKAATRALEDWPTALPFLSLQDFSTIDNFSFSPYIRQKSEEMVTPRPDIRGRTAIVLKKSFGARLVQVFLLAKKNKLRQRQLFFSREEALKWLAEWLDPANVPSD
jgi:hypothetical protein